MWVAFPEPNRNREYLVAYREDRWMLMPVRVDGNRIVSLGGPVIYGTDFDLPLIDLVEMITRHREEKE